MDTCTQRYTAYRINKYTWIHCLGYSVQRYMFRDTKMHAHIDTLPAWDTEIQGYTHTEMHFLGN